MQRLSSYLETATIVRLDRPAMSNALSFTSPETSVGTE
jgi:hypothetical protein